MQVGCVENGARTWSHDPAVLCRLCNSSACVSHANGGWKVSCSVCPQLKSPHICGWEGSFTFKKGRLRPSTSTPLQPY